jgi:hypothetical protein
MNEKDLRDCFAMFALNGMLGTTDWFGNVGHWKTRKEMLNTYADEAYGFADAMLEARSKEPEVEEGIVAVKPRKRATK